MLCEVCGDARPLHVLRMPITVVHASAKCMTMLHAAQRQVADKARAKEHAEMEAFRLSYPNEHLQLTQVRPHIKVVLQCDASLQRARHRLGRRFVWPMGSCGQLI